MEELRPSLRKQYSPFEHVACSLPAPTAQCHASNLLLLEDGGLLCAWFGGSLEGNPDVSIYLSRLPANATIWSAAEKMTHDGTKSEQNPVLFNSPAGDIWLLYTSQTGKDQDSAVVKHCVSKDGGNVWSEPAVLLGEPGTFIREPMIALPDGRWVLPTFKCQVESGVRWIGNDDISSVHISSDEGNTWSETIVPNSFGCVHMGIRQLKNESYLAMYRSRWADNIYSSTSVDAEHWTEPKATVLPNNNAGICFDVLPSGRVVLVYNHSSKANAKDGPKSMGSEPGYNRSIQAPRSDGRDAFWGAPRAPLCVAWSDDDGVTWRHRVLQDGDGYCMSNNSGKKENRELSYPSMVVGLDGTIHIAFTFWRQKLKYVRLDNNCFRDGEL